MSIESTNAENGNAQQLIADADPKAIKRAQWEAFEFDIKPPSTVIVRNGSHADPDDHTYEVDVENGMPTACGCPADTHQDGPCKHRVAIAIREPILEAVTATSGAHEPLTITDGGMTVEQANTDETAASCPYDHPECEGVDADRERPELCFECWRVWAKR